MKLDFLAISAIFLVAILIALIFPLDNNNSIGLNLRSGDDPITFSVNQPLEQIIHLLDLHAIDYMCDKSSVIINGGEYTLHFDKKSTLALIIMKSGDGAGVILPKDYHDQETGIALLEAVVRLCKALAAATALSVLYIICRRAFRSHHSNR